MAVKVMKLCITTKVSEASKYAVNKIYIVRGLLVDQRVLDRKDKCVPGYSFCLIHRIHEMRIVYGLPNLETIKNSTFNLFYTYSRHFSSYESKAKAISINSFHELIHYPGFMRNRGKMILCRQIKDLPSSFLFPATLLSVVGTSFLIQCIVCLCYPIGTRSKDISCSPLLTKPFLSPHKLPMDDSDI
ncbi:hypothetical protein AVEN_148386-1 [Araneus ventricosus]|uniref:Uncharacterized protein n=1 Tax=Araneus ventricosus TaxID=182803 RepID=A0A4Y2VV68_ARAVE|nr:hypothetical protein AVEN_100130-1 [Araneus ventricosus]GBO29024.1 hypothetical protein AVEN_249065-1 [Araneus ventricosus]GBO29026.1 hypothetical protein AVEN_23524-1 [Araneus ventricosus]GBO29029.1 hypothetical protein AVEN_148386-1 [Araneus ventricosus]